MCLVLSWSLRDHLSAYLGAGLSTSSVGNVARASEEQSVVTDGGKPDQICSLCCCLSELLIQKLLGCLLAPALEIMTVPGVAEEPVYRYNP